MHMKKPRDLEKTLNKPNNFLAQDMRARLASPTLFSQGLVAARALKRNGTEFHAKRINPARSHFERAVRV